MFGWYMIVVWLVAVPAAAQTFYDKSGDPHGHLERQGDRLYLRDNAGNPRGYFVQHGATIEHHDNAGNLLGTTKVK